MPRGSGAAILPPEDENAKKDTPDSDDIIRPLSKP